MVIAPDATIGADAPHRTVGTGADIDGVAGDLRPVYPEIEQGDAWVGVSYPAGPKAHLQARYLVHPGLVLRPVVRVQCTDISICLSFVMAKYVPID